MIIDAHAHIGPILAHRAPGNLEFDAVRAAGVVKEMDKFGIDKVIAFAPLYDGGFYDDPDYQLGNYAIFQACQEYPDRIIGYGRVNPNRKGAAVAEFLHCLDDYQLTGLILHPDWESFNPANQRLMWPLAEICAERKLPISFHVGYYPKCQPLLFIPLAETFPTVPIFLKHIGYEYWRDAVIMAQRYPNVYVETANNSTVGEIYAAIREAGANKVCFGSDLPYHMPQVIMKKIRMLPISEEEKALVLGLNAARINNVAVEVER